MKNVILTDVDGVLLNWEGAFQTWLANLGYIKPADAPTDSYSLAKCNKLPEWLIEDLVKEFNGSSHCAFLKPYEEAQQYVRQLADRGYKFVTCTAFGGCDQSRRRRVFNLENVFGEEIFAGHQVIELKGDKRPFLRQYAGTGAFWLEDNINNAQAGYDLGLNAVLVRHPHNVAYSDRGEIRVANGWKDIFNLIVENETR